MATKKKETKLIPVDTERCQGESRSFMTLGPGFHRCTNKASVVLSEIERDDDEPLGAMSLCDDCHKIFEEREPDKAKKVTVQTVDEYLASKTEDKPAKNKKAPLAVANARDTESLKDVAYRLYLLLNDPQPGMSTWRELLSQRLEEIARAAPLSQDTIERALAKRLVNVIMTDGAEPNLFVSATNVRRLAREMIAESGKKGAVLLRMLDRVDELLASSNLNG